MTMGQPHQNQGPGEPAPEGQEYVAEGTEGSEPAPVWSGFVGGREKVYNDPNEIVRDYQQSSDEAMRLRAELDALRATQQTQRFPEPTQPADPPWLEGLTTAGVPEPVARQMASWMEQQTDFRAAQKMEELVNGLSSIAQKENQADAVLSQELQGYSKAALEQRLAMNPEFKQRYDRIFQVDPEGAKRLAWLSLDGGSTAPRPTSRMTTPPTSRRVQQNAPVQEAAQLKKLLESANNGGQAQMADYMAQRLKKHFSGE
jgi:hypothetical protein